MRTLKLFLSFCITLLILEGMLQLARWPRGEVAGWTMKDIAETKRLNKLGFRGRAIRYNEQDIVVVLVGDSQIVGIRSAFENIPERILERVVHGKGFRKLKVFSVGASGYGQDQQLFALRKYFESYRADLVLLWSYPENDLVDNTHLKYNPAQIKPTFRLEGDQLIEPEWDYLKEVHYGPRLLGRFKRWRKKLINEWEASLPPAYEPFEENKRRISKQWYPPVKNSFFKKEMDPRSILFSPRSARCNYSINLTHRLFSEINHLCKENGSDFMILNVVKPGEIGHKDYPVGVFEHDEHFYLLSNQQLRKNMQDLYEGFRRIRIVVTLDDWRVHEHDSHLNAAANEQVFNILFERIKPTLRKLRKKKRLEAITLNELGIIDAIPQQLLQESNP